MFTNIRVVCNNTLTAALKGAKNKIKIRHTTNSETRIKEAEKTLLASAEYWDVMKDACTKLAATSVDRVAVGSFIDYMFPVDETKKERKNSAREKVEELVETAKGNDIPGVKGTAWGLLNSYTEYLDHHAVVKCDGDRWERSMFGSNYNKRQQAFDYLMKASA
jgi:phage/plasmid-like protein (TIGR03299 family)